jgi:hypothetical protein
VPGIARHHQLGVDELTHAGAADLHVHVALVEREQRSGRVDFAHSGHDFRAQQAAYVDAAQSTQIRQHGGVVDTDSLPVQGYLIGEEKRSVDVARPGLGAPVDEV